MQMGRKAMRKRGKTRDKERMKRSTMKRKGKEDTEDAFGNDGRQN